MARRVLVTGSRDWADIDLVRDELAKLTEPNNHLTVVHGACPTGADAIADLWAQQNAFVNERHPADWKRYGRRAGFIRNAEMVALGADVCLAFWKDGSRGTAHTMTLAQDAGIPVRRFVTPDASLRHNRQGCWSCMKDQPVLHATSEGVAADNLQQQLDELEPRYLETLDADERGGR